MLNDSPRTHRPAAKTDHATKRQAQRAVTDAGIAAALDFGREIPAGSGDVFLYLGRNEVRRAAALGHDLRRYEGITVVLLPNGIVKTMWRAQKPPRAGGGRVPRRRRRQGGRR